MGYFPGEGGGELLHGSYTIPPGRFYEFSTSRTHSSNETSKEVVSRVNKVVGLNCFPLRNRTEVLTNVLQPHLLKKTGAKFLTPKKPSDLSILPSLFYVSIPLGP